VLDPVGRDVEAVGLEPARPELPVAAARDEAGALEHLQVLGDRRQAHVERLGQVVHGRFPVRELGQDRPPGGVGQRREGRIQPAVVHR